MMNFKLASKLYFDIIFEIAKKNRTLSPINTDANEIEGISTESMPDVVVAGQSVPFNIIGPSRTRYYWQTSDGESFTGSSNKLRFDMPGQASVAIEVRYQDGKTDQRQARVCREDQFCQQPHPGGWRIPGLGRDRQSGGWIAMDSASRYAC